MKKHAYLMVGAAALALGVRSADAAVLFGFEPGAEELPETGNAAFAYTVGTSTTNGVTQGVQSLSVTQNFSNFGGPASNTFTDATAATLIDAATSLTVDLTVPNVPINFGNIDFHFFQNSNPVGLEQSQETNFSGTFALSSGHTITLTVPLTRQDAAPGTKVLLDPTLPFAFQIDFSDGFTTPLDGSNPATFYVDNISVATPAVPEPASLGLLALGGLFLKRRGR